MYRIMFVCHGNICRSPMAEFVCRDIIKKAGTEDMFEVSSSAVSDEEIYGGIGNPVYPPVASLLRCKGIDCSGKRVAKLVPRDAENYDLFVCMDEGNVREAVRILGARHKNKCVKLMSYSGSDDDVSDPWYTRDFDTCYNDIYRGIKAMTEKLANKNNDPA